MIPFFSHSTTLCLRAGFTHSSANTSRSYSSPSHTVRSKKKKRTSSFGVFLSHCPTPKKIMSLSQSSCNRCSASGPIVFSLLNFSFGLPLEDREKIRVLDHWNDDYFHEGEIVRVFGLPVFSADVRSSMLLALVSALQWVHHIRCAAIFQEEWSGVVCFGFPGRPRDAQRFARLYKGASRQRRASSADDSGDDSALLPSTTNTGCANALLAFGNYCEIAVIPSFGQVPYGFEVLDVQLHLGTSSPSPATRATDLLQPLSSASEFPSNPCSAEDLQRLCKGGTASPRDQLGFTSSPMPEGAVGECSASAVDVLATLKQLNQSKNSPDDAFKWHSETWDFLTEYRAKASSEENLGLWQTSAVSTIASGEGALWFASPPAGEQCTFCAFDNAVSSHLSCCDGGVGVIGRPNGDAPPVW